MASMAIAQVWKGATALPCLSAMSKAVEEQHAWLAECAQQGTNVSPGMVDPGAWVRAMDDLAGTGVNEYLGYGWKGWAFWWRDKRFCRLLMDGIWSPHVHRLFEGKRKPWVGAREAIELANKLAAEEKKKRKSEVENRKDKAA